jgi:hypothetical protein
MTIPQWPAGTFGWLVQLFNAAASAKLVAEGYAVIEMIVAVAPRYRGRPLLEGQLLHQAGRYQEASQVLAEMVRADPSYVYARYVLYQSLWAMDNSDWVEHAHVVAAAGHDELSPIAQRKLMDAGQASVSVASDLNAQAASAVHALYKMMVRV